jgi:hypothetical protein
MKEIKFHKKDTPQGEVNITMRIIGKIIYFKFAESSYAEQVIHQLRQKGAIINKGSKSWLSVDMFSNFKQTYFKLDGKEFDTSTCTEEELEDILANFYVQMYSKAGFEII